MKKVLGILLGVLLASNAYSQVTGSTIRVMNWGTYSNWLASMTETNVVIYPTSIITNLNVIVVTNLTINITTNYSFYSSTNEQSYTIITNSPWLTNVTGAAISAAGGLTNNSFLINGVPVGTGSNVTVAASGGGNIYAISNNVFATTTPITFTNANAALRQITSSITNSFYFTSTSAVWTVNGTNYAFP